MTVSPVILPLSDRAAALPARLVGLCVSCGSLCIQTGADLFAHLADQCRECFGTGKPCPYPEDHGLHRLSIRIDGVRQIVACTEPEPESCQWCRNVFDATQTQCPDHRGCCGNCCEPV